MTDGSCLCGAVGWRFDGTPASALSCNCTACRRYGVLWAYGLEGQGIDVWGPTRPYIRGDSIEFHCCTTCGCLAFWRARRTGDDGRRRIAVNVRLAAPEAVAAIPVVRSDGLGDFADLPDDGRRVGDHWF